MLPWLAFSRISIIFFHNETPLFRSSLLIMVCRITSECVYQHELYMRPQQFLCGAVLELQQLQLVECMLRSVMQSCFTFISNQQG